MATATRINTANFPNGIEVWVSNPCESRTGNTIYWCTIEEWNHGEVLYLSKAAWQQLDDVNDETVGDLICNGEWEIAPAKDVETGEQLYVTDKDGNPTSEEIWQVRKARKTSKHMCKA